MQWVEGQKKEEEVVVLMADSLVMAVEDKFLMVEVDVVDHWVVVVVEDKWPMAEVVVVHY